MGEKGKTVAQKDKLEIKKMLIAGLLLALLSFIIIFLWVWSSYGFRSLGKIITEADCRSCTEQEIAHGIACITRCALSRFQTLIYTILPTLSFVYLILAVLAYLISLKFDDNRVKLHFIAGSLLVAAIILFVLAMFAPMILYWLVWIT